VEAPEDLTAGVVTPSATERLRGTAALRAHLTLAAGLVLCASAFWFEIGRAQRGNSLSWAYVFEWPLLGGFGIYMWWRVTHPDHTRSKSPRTAAPAVAPQYEGMLAAWQEHQRDLAAREHRGLDAAVDGSDDVRDSN
jgi:hypothetical protein